MRGQLTAMKFAARFIPLVVLGLVSAVVLGGGNAIAGTIFSDNFTGPALDPTWQVLAGQGTYSLVGGNLRYFNQGPSSAPAGWSTTSLSLALPFTGTSWQVDVRAKYSLNWLGSGNYTGPSVPSPGGSTGAQRPEVLVSFDPVTASDRSALAGSNFAGFDRGIDAWYGDNHLWAWYGNTSVTGLLNPADSTITNNIADGAYWLRFARNGGMLSLRYSYDGVNYSEALSAALANPSSSFNQLLLTGNTFATSGSFTDYDYVTITDTVPEPGTFALVSLSIVAIGLLKLRRN